MTPEILAQQERNSRNYLAMEDQVRDLCGLVNLMAIVVDGIVDEPEHEKRDQDGSLVIDKWQEENLRFIAWKIEREAKALQRRYQNDK